MATIEFTYEGADKVRERLVSLVRQFPDICLDALREEAEIEKTESMRRTPVDTGALRSSHLVMLYKRSDELGARIGVGGTAAPYALIVHEDEEVFHKVGQAKFLESTIMESKRYMAQRLANRIKMKLPRAVRS